MLHIAIIVLYLFARNSISHQAPPYFITPPAEISAEEMPITPLADNPITLEQYVREYFKDAPILAEIAGCESRFRHLGRDGKVIRGKVSMEDIGIMQINEFYHEERARKLGFNLRTLEGNLAYAAWLYGKEGTAPWLSSARCWLGSENLASADTKENAN